MPEWRTERRKHTLKRVGGTASPHTGDPSSGPTQHRAKGELHPRVQPREREYRERLPWPQAQAQVRPVRVWASDLHDISPERSTDG